MIGSNFRNCYGPGSGNSCAGTMKIAIPRLRAGVTLTPPSWIYYYNSIVCPTVTSDSKDRKPRRWSMYPSTSGTSNGSVSLADGELRAGLRQFDESEAEPRLGPEGSKKPLSVGPWTAQEIPASCSRSLVGGPKLPESSAVFELWVHVTHQNRNRNSGALFGIDGSGDAIKGSLGLVCDYPHGRAVECA